MKRARLKFLVCSAALALVFGLSFWQPGAGAAASDDIRAKIEQAGFSRREFFGTEAIFPYPTTEARENLARLAAEFPDDPAVLRSLAETAEALGEFEEAEKHLIHLAGIDPARRYELGGFYHRRARFADEAKNLANMLVSPAVGNKEAIVRELLDLANTHDLKEYLRPEFYDRAIAENPTVFSVFQEFADRLTEEKNYTAALALVRGAKGQFPGQRSILLDKEVSLLLETGKHEDAEKVYLAGYDPFWDEDESEKFYRFLSEHDRLREYGAELKAGFSRDPGDFDAAIKLTGYRRYRGDEIASVVAKLEKAKKTWTTEELVTITRLLLREYEGEMASRFLYTLYARGDFKQRGDLRARVLYQLFEMFSDAETQKLPITRGDLRFYEEIAKTDTDPGITTGILSLIFSDSNPGEHLVEREIRANQYFNRAAAYKIFLAYRDEFPASPELYQMYLDLVRLYTATKEPEIANEVLSDFAEKYRESRDYPDAALKLADAFETAGDRERSRTVCREILDYLGKQGTPEGWGATVFVETDENRSLVVNDAGNTGINIPNTPKANSQGPPDAHFIDHLARENKAVSYAEVLEKLIASLAREKMTPEILELYSAEIAKYPQAEWLYEQRLSWLEKTNLTEDQLAVYREALNRFQSTTWSDKLARWFVRQKRESDLSELSSDLVSKLSDREVQVYLAEMVDSKMSASEFEKQMYLQLYAAAHRRFPHNIAFVKGLLRYYRNNKLDSEWRRLAGEYYFISPEVRQMFLDDLAAKGDLRAASRAATSDDLAYRTFRADAAMRLSNFEEAVATYRELNTAYPNSPDILGRLIELSRSFGQKDSAALSEAAQLAVSRAGQTPSSAEFRTVSGEIYAESGDLQKAREEWEKLIATGAGRRETWLDTATVYWDYFQYEDARSTIDGMRKKFADGDAYAFEAGAIYEALHEREKAVREYVKALGSTEEDDSGKEKAKNRLATLAKKENTLAQIKQAFLAEQNSRPGASYLALGYADFLASIEKRDEAVGILDAAIAQSRDARFLEAALDLSAGNELLDGERHTLARLAEVSASPRRKIKYSLRLARSFEEGRDRDAAKSVLSALAQKFPNNYGVITETADLYRRLGFEAESADFLQKALARSRGVYKNKLAAKLSQRLIDLNRLDEAALILTRLHAENPADQDLFRELAGIYVRRSEPDALRTAFGQTVAALKRSDTDRRELNDQIAELRKQMIDAFTRLKDYRSAVEQHIEIINREPENEELTENAIAYANRYGGGDTLLAYYQKTSAEAFKNYRWNVVLARIFEARGDLESAVRNYGAAIDNQPEMSELFEARADLRVKQGNFDLALKDMDTVLEMTGDAPEQIRKKIEILKKAGRTREAEAEKAKLPAAEKPQVEVDGFARARQNTEKEEARRLYREAFDALVADPLSGELKGGNIVDYVRSVREEEPLDKISIRLWDLRRKLIGLAGEAESTRAGEARNRLAVLDAAIPASVGELAGSIATDEELAALHADLKDRIAGSTLNDQYRTLDEILDISRKAHLDLEETILRKRVAQTETGTARQAQLKSLTGFYLERGAYERALAAMEEFGSDDLPAMAQAARLTGSREKELDALRAIYADQKTAGPAQNENIARFLQLLYEGGRDELASLARGPSPYQFQLINFLLGKGEFELAHAAVESAPMPNAWKRSRHAEVDLALKRSRDGEKCGFCDVLRLASVQQTIAQTYNKEEFPVGDDWFRLGREYGEWLYDSPRGAIKPSLYLAAMTENQPQNGDRQTGLGVFYMTRKEPAAAIQHFRMAVEIDPGDKAAASDLAAAYFLAGRRQDADETVDQSFSGAGPGELLVFFREFEKFGLAAEAAGKIAPGIVKFLVDSDVDDSEDMQALVRVVAASFKDGAGRAAYFRAILDRRPTDTSLATFLIDESLIEPAGSDYFYKRVIEANDGLEYDEDYSFRSIARRTWSRDDAESVYDQENEYEIEEPENRRYTWQKRYLETLLSLKRNAEASLLAGSMEKELGGKYARPAWLRLAGLRLQARAGRVNLEEWEQFTGIRVSGSASEIGPPSLERFNDAFKMLKAEGRGPEAVALSVSYFARMLALDQFASSNFAGLARALFARGDAETALKIARLMVDAAGDARETALAEIGALDAVRQRVPDPAKAGDLPAAPLEDGAGVLALAARLAIEFGRPNEAIAFRRQFMGLDPANEANAIELSKLLASKGEKAEAAEILKGVVANRDTSRISRWRAKWELREMGESVEIENLAYDPFSQYYRALIAEKEGKGAAIDLLVASLIAGGDDGGLMKQYLVRVYALADKPYAALKLAESDKAEKPDELWSLLSEAAEKTGNFAKAIEYEKLRPEGGNPERIKALERKMDPAGRRATDMIVDAANTRKL